MKAALMSALAGLLFAFGLGLGGMTDPQKVRGFLDFAGAWDPSLAWVMGGALLSHGLLRRIVLRRPRPLFAAAFPQLPDGSIDRRLLAGAALFGVGWGLGGYCPGPAMTSLGTGQADVLTFVVAMASGMTAHQLWSNLRAPRPATDVATAPPPPNAPGLAG